MLEYTGVYVRIEKIMRLTSVGGQFQKAQPQILRKTFAKSYRRKFKLKCEDSATQSLFFVVYTTRIKTIIAKPQMTVLFIE